MQFKIFKNYKTQISYGLSDKSHGAMELVSQFQTPVGQPRRLKFFKLKKLNASRAVFPYQTHSRNIQAITAKSAGKIVANTDGLLTNIKNLILTVTVADCFPIYFFDPQHQVIGLAHAGWRGVLKRLPQRVVKKMENTYLTDPSQLLVGIGPGIKKCHFEVKQDVFHRFAKFPQGRLKRHGRLFIDLPQVIKIQLLTAGVLKRHIETAADCTYCKRYKFFSFRRDKPLTPQAMLAYIKLTEKS